MNRMSTAQAADGTWEARVGNPALYVIRIRRSRTRARLAALRMYLTGVGVTSTLTA